jgi:hypothetical protein
MLAGLPTATGLAWISHTIFPQLSSSAREFISVGLGIRDRGVGRRGAGGLLRSCGEQRRDSLGGPWDGAAQFHALRQRVSRWRAAGGGCGIETSSSPAPDGGDGTARGHGELDAPNAASNECADLEQLYANGAARCLGEFGVMQRDPTQATKQHVGERAQPET